MDTQFSIPSANHDVIQLVVYIFIHQHPPLCIIHTHQMHNNILLFDYEYRNMYPPPDPKPMPAEAIPTIMFRSLVG